MKCDCKERVNTKITSWKQYEELKVFFDGQVKRGVFYEISVEKPYYVGHSSTEKIEWYADKMYKCVECATVWEFVFPDFPAYGFVRKSV